MKAISYLAACALLAGTAAAGNNGDPLDPSVEEPVLEQPNVAAETEGLIPSTYKTLFKNHHLEITWGGRIFLDFGWFDADPSFLDDSGNIGGDGAEFRAARFYAAGTLYDSIDFKTDMEFEGNDENNFKDVYIGMDTPLGYVKVGHFKEPFSLEQLTSSRFITFMERSLADVFTPGRNTGLQLSDYMEDSGNLNWAVGVFRDSVDGGLSQSDGDYSLTGRLAGSIVRDPENVLHGGIGYSMRSDVGGMIAFSEEPEVHMLANLGGASLAADDATVGNLELAWVGGPLSVQGEYMMASINAASGGMDGDYTGYYVLGSYFLTGESRNYKAKGAKFDRIKPRDNYDGGGGSGAWELAGRLSMADFNDGPTNNETMNYTIGLNWYLNPHTRIMLNWVHSEFEAGAVDDSLDAVMLRFQVDF